MSEIARNASISTESLCTVIENEIGKPKVSTEIDDLTINTDIENEFEEIFREINREIEKDLNEKNIASSKDLKSTSIIEPQEKPLNGHLKICEDAESIENCDKLKYKEIPNGKISNGLKEESILDSLQENSVAERNSESNIANDSALESETSVTEATPTPTPIEDKKSAAKPKSKLKKSVSFDPNDEKIQKFITGEPIVDQKNPFKNQLLVNGSAGKKKKTPPPVPTRRSTLSVKKTVTQQLREREREKEKERERLKNEQNQQRSKSAAGTPTSPDEFITTEEVLKQSKYVKTYIKNPDSYFVYDPAVLARIKFEDLRQLSDQKPPKRLKDGKSPRNSFLDSKANNNNKLAAKSKLPTFKKCSKPNYPNLSDLKIKIGTESDGNYFNPVEVTKNAKKFDERVKKLRIDSDVDLDEFEEPLTKSESSDEVTVNSSTSRANEDEVDGKTDLSIEIKLNGSAVMNDSKGNPGTFTNTIESREFQEYLQKKGLTLIPKKIPSGAQPMYANGGILRNTPNGAHVSFKITPEKSNQLEMDKIEITEDSSFDSSSKHSKKPSVFQRLLANSIFASRRSRTTPKEIVPNPRPLYDQRKENGVPTPAIKRVVLERQSFHGRHRVGDLLNALEIQDLQDQNERSRKSFASGDDLSLSISSALTNAEYGSDAEPRKLTSGRIDSRSSQSSIPRRDLNNKQAIAKPPRRTLSGDRLTSNSHNRQVEQPTSILKPKAQRPYQVTRTERPVDVPKPYEAQVPLQRSLERQSLIPKRSTQDVVDRRQAFARSSSMDRHEILKRNAARRLQNRSNSANDTLKLSASSKEQLRIASPESYGIDGGPRITSTPRRASDGDRLVSESYVSPTERKAFSPVILNSAKPGNVYVDQQEWERLRAIKEKTDRELYFKVMQQQKQQQQQQLRNGDMENIYEHLPHRSNVLIHKAPEEYIIPNGPNTFIRGSPQRNTFSGVIRSNRQAKIIDGKAHLMPQAETIKADVHQSQQQVTPRSQSVLDNVTAQKLNRFPRRDYESDNETPIVMRRKHSLTTENAQQQPTRRIGGLLTREEILQKVKEFCRKSLNKTPTPQPVQIHAIYEGHPISTDISPVSYASVDTNHPRSSTSSRMYAAPQVPLRLQSLQQQQQQQQQQFAPIIHEATSSPIYAHVVKRSSLQSNQSDLYDTPPSRPILVRRINDPNQQQVYVRRAPLIAQPSQEILVPTQYIIVDSEKLTPAQVVNYQNYAQASDLYSQPQYVRPHQLQALPNSYGYVTLKEPVSLLQTPAQQQPQYVRGPLVPAMRLHDGRSTPLILESSSSPQQVSQIYWTPQHQRLQQQAGLLPVQISPRYVVKQTYPVSLVEKTNPQISRITKSGTLPAATTTTTTTAAVKIQQRQPQPLPQSFSPITQNAAAAATTTQIYQMQPRQQQLQQQQQQQHYQPVPQPRKVSNVKNPNLQYANNVSDWESGSEAGEVQRIMERQRDNSGESKTSNIFRNLKSKVSHFFRVSTK